MSTAAAADVADRYLNSIRYGTALMTGWEPWAEEIITASRDAALALSTKTATVTVAEGGHGSALLSGDWTSKFNAPPWPRMREILFQAQDAATQALWQLHRIVYDFDPDLWDALGDPDEATVIPAGLLSRLPHPDPFIALPQELVVPISAEHRARIGGFFVTGRATAVAIGAAVGAVTGAVSVGASASTHSPNASGDLCLLIGGEVEDYQGRPHRTPDGKRDMIWSRVTLDVAGGDTTLGALIDAIAARFDEGNTYHPNTPAGSFEETVRPVLARVVTGLVYLCAANAELRPVPAAASARAARQPGRKSTTKPPKVVQVGFQVGTALRAHRRAETAGQPGGGGGERRRPHVRRSHYHLYWTGPGRTVPAMKWLPPIPINATGSPATQTTVVAVPRD